MTTFNHHIEPCTLSFEPSSVELHFLSIPENPSGSGGPDPSGSFNSLPNLTKATPK